MMRKTSVNSVNVPEWKIRWAVADPIIKVCGSGAGVIMSIRCCSTVHWHACVVPYVNISVIWSQEVVVAAILAESKNESGLQIKNGKGVISPVHALVVMWGVPFCSTTAPVPWWYQREWIQRIRDSNYGRDLNYWVMLKDNQHPTYRSNIRFF